MKIGTHMPDSERRKPVGQKSRSHCPSTCSQLGFRGGYWFFLLNHASIVRVVCAKTQNTILIKFTYLYTGRFECFIKDGYFEILCQ
jgi:hypothetical protein